MTSVSDNEFLSCVGPETPMGALMRRYWIPAAKSTELERNGPPVRLVLLGERLIAFRDSSGRVGVMDHRCPHRCASLFFGRNEEGGLRCVYHGWKFDVDGACLDMPNLPTHQNFKDKVRAKAYTVAERNGLVWVFMGERGAVPPLPEIEATFLPEKEAVLHFVQRECNWLQALEGDLDSSHIGFLHFGAAMRGNYDERNSKRHIVASRDPKYQLTNTEYGAAYGVYRPAEGGGTYWRVGHFLFPFWALPPICAIEQNILARAWVPMDDTHTMFVSISHPGANPANEPHKDVAGASLVENLLPNSPDWYGRFRLAENMANDYQIDRDVQRRESFTGIEGIHTQDQAITESMGAIVDRGLEHLAPSDIMVAQLRRSLLNAATALSENGESPPAADRPEACRRARGGFYIAEDSGDWFNLYRSRLDAALGGTNGAPTEA